MDVIWICGANGQLGKAITNQADRLEYEILNTDEEEIDVTDIDSVLRYGKLNRPDVIINCAAVKDYKRCENDIRHAFMVNALGARNLSIAARKIESKLVQISTDDVFDGKKDGPYNEYDLPNPYTVYGKSKYAGESYVKEFCSKHFIVRSTWVYGEGDNFITDFLKKVEQGERIRISGKQYGTPTSAEKLAEFIMQLIKTNEYGTYHATNKGVCSRLEFAQMILKILGKDADLSRVSADESDFQKKLPVNSVLENFVLDITGIYQFPEWEVSLTNYLKGSNIYEG